MSLQDVASGHIREIFDDPDGPGRDVTLTNPVGDSAQVRGVPNAVPASVDPETGQTLGGNLITISFSLAALEDAGIGTPIGINDATKKPWVAEYVDGRAKTRTLKVSHAEPDDELGVVHCTCVTYAR